MYTPLHLVPPSVPGLIGAIENKYKINASNIRYNLVWVHNCQVHLGLGVLDEP